MFSGIFTILLFVGFTNVVSAQKEIIPSDQWGEDTRLYAAQACYAETGFEESDCGEILWVLIIRWERVKSQVYRDPNTRERRQWLLSDMIREYVAALSPNQAYYPRLSLRQREIRKFPWGDLGEMPKHILRISQKASLSRFNVRWAFLREYVEKWGRGEIKQRCRGADHWGAPYGNDLVRAKKAAWKKVECDTKNDFYRSLRKRRKLIAYR
jgi:hypothetical protein